MRNTMKHNLSVALVKDRVVVKCSECKDTGKLEIRNAYDPDYVEYEDCSYCKLYRDALKNILK